MLHDTGRLRWCTLQGQKISTHCLVTRYVSRPVLIVEMDAYYVYEFLVISLGNYIYKAGISMYPGTT